MRLDLIVIKKDPCEILSDPLGSTFRMYNLFEYKSPDDRLSIDEFSKAMGYSLLYKGYDRKSDEIPFDEMTLTIVRHRYPRDLISSLKKEGCTVTQIHPGIYEVSGKTFISVHIVVSSQLSKEDYLSLRLIAKDNIAPVEVKDFTAKVKSTEDENLKNYLSMMIRICFQANPELLDRIKEDEDMRDPFKEWMDEQRAEGREEGRAEEQKETAEIMLKDREPIEKIVRFSRLSKNAVLSLAAELGITPVMN